MTDIDERLRDYAQRWRDAQPSHSELAVGPTRRTRAASRRRRRLAVVAAAAAAAAGAAVIAVGATVDHGRSPDRLSTTNPAQVSAVSASLVRIVSTLGYNSAQAIGTGIVVTPSGEVLTNNLVIDGATAITVADTADGRSYAATVVGYDIPADVAVLQMQGASGLKAAPIGDSSEVKVGQPVLALEADGLNGAPAITAATVTALNQSATVSDEANGSSQSVSGLIATHAAPPGGSSGGPLVGAGGSVIGVATGAPSIGPDNSTSSSIPTSPGSAPSTAAPLTLTPTQPTSGSPASGRSYAIPINTALSIANQIQAGHGSGEVHVGPTAFLGVLVNTGSGTSAAAPMVAGVVAGSPTARAGLTAGDRITAIDGHAVGSLGALTAQLAEHHPGDTVSLNWIDPSGAPHSTALVLAAGPAA